MTRKQVIILTRDGVNKMPFGQEFYLCDIPGFWQKPGIYGKFFYEAVHRMKFFPDVELIGKRYGANLYRRIKPGDSAEEITRIND